MLYNDKEKVNPWFSFLENGKPNFLQNTIGFYNPVVYCTFLFMFIYI